MSKLVRWTAVGWGGFISSAIAGSLYLDLAPEGSSRFQDALLSWGGMAAAAALGIWATAAFTRRFLTESRQETERTRDLILVGTAASD